eukprot:g8414.t1
MPMLVSPEDSAYFDVNTHDDEAVPQRPGWMEQSYSQHKLDLVAAANEAQRNLVHRPDLNKDRSVRPGWMAQSVGADAQSVRPGWIDEVESVAAQSIRPDWIDETESVAAQSVRPGWMDDTESVAAQSARPGWMDETESVAAQSVRPGWMGDTGSVAAQSARPGWMDDTESVAAQSVRPGWMDETESVATQSVRPGWMDDTGSIAAQSARPGWMDETESVAAQSVRPGWMVESRFGVGDAEPNGFDARQSAVDESSVRPGWMHDDARSQRPGWFEDAAAASVKRPGSVSPKAALEERPASPETTRGGQSSSEGAERPRSELADSPKETANRATAATLTGSRTPHTIRGDSEIHNEGGLLGLILDTDEKDALRRKNEKLRSAERARRVFSSSPAEGNRKEVDELPKQQVPRQGTAEAAKVRIVRSKTMPMAEHASTTPLAAVRAKRSTPTSASSQPGEGAAPPSPAPKRDGSEFKAGSPTPARTAIPPPPHDANRTSGGGIAAPQTGGVRARKVPRDGTHKTPPIPRAASTEAMLNALKLPGASEARGFLSVGVASPGDSPRKKERRVSTPRGDPKARAPSSAGAHGPSPSNGRGTREKRDSSGGTPSENPSPSTMKRVDERIALTTTSSEDLGGKDRGPSPHLRSRPCPESISDMPPPKVVIKSSSPRVTRDPKKPRSSRPSKPKLSTESKPPSEDTRPRRSSESSSTSSADSKGNTNTNTGRPTYRDRQPTGGGASSALEAVRVRPSVEQRQALAAAEKMAAPAHSPPASKAGAKMWTTRNPAAAAAADAAGPGTAVSTVGSSVPSAQREAAMALSMGRGAHETPQGAFAALAAPLSKPIVPVGRRGRQQPKFGTPRERRATRNPSRTRLRITSDLPPLEEEVGIPTSPVTVNPVRGAIEVPAFAGNRGDKNYVGPGSAKDLAERLLAEKLGKAAEHGAPTSSTRHQEGSGLQIDSGSEHPRKAPGGHAAATEDKYEYGKRWLKQRAIRFPAATVQEDSVRRRGSQRLSRSSSWDDGSSSSFHGQQAMFSPGRFNPTSGALSWGSVDDSWCEGSVRSAMTAGTRNSSSASLVSVRGPSDRKLAPPQLSKSEKQTVELLKIKRSQVHFGYRTVGGSERVYKIELNGEMRAAKVINTLGMNKEEMAEVLDTFDAELLALSRINSPHIVKVYGASVSPAEIIVVSEFVEGGVLQSVLHNPRKRKHLTQRVRLGIAKDTALGMKSLYAHGMQHRHLSSKSILLTSDFRAKILGVGLTMTTELISFFNGEEHAEEEIEDGLPWASREVLAGAGFSEKSDVYSFGMVLWELMQKDPCLPYAGLLPSQVVGAKYNGEGPPLPKHCPSPISSLMESCWSNLPAERPSFVEICKILDATIV